MTLKEKLAGKFIVFDGPDGSGKGTQIEMLTRRLTDEGLEVVYAKDPGGTKIGDRIREILLHYDLSEMDVRCETFLFMASRAQLTAKVVDPAVCDGKVVLGDRYISSTYAYQGAAGYDVSRLIELSKLAVGDTWPALTLIIDIPAEMGLKRTGRDQKYVGKRRSKVDTDQGLLFSDGQTDAMEARTLDFHRKVRKRFLKLPTEYPSQVEVIDGAGAPEEVHQRIMERIARVDF